MLIYFPLFLDVSYTVVNILQRIKCSRSSESERQSSPNIGSIAEPVSKRLEDVSSLNWPLLISF